MNETKISAFEQAVHAVNPEAEMPTLKAVAAAMDIPYPRLSAVSKQPEEGMVYDRNAFNWFAISRFLTRRLDPETGFATLEEIAARALELNDEFKAADGRRTAAVGKQTITLEDGTQIPARKYNFEIGDTTTIKKDESGKVYEVVYLTVSHVVLKVVGGEALYRVSNNTANWRLTPPAKAKTEAQG